MHYLSLFKYYFSMLSPYFYFVWLGTLFAIQRDCKIIVKQPGILTDQK